MLVTFTNIITALISPCKVRLRHDVQLTLKARASFGVVQHILDGLRRAQRERVLV